MAFRKLIEGDCGQENALSHITGHFTQDMAKLDKLPMMPQPLEFQTHGNADQLVQEFMQETMAVPQTFRMDNLLEEMREIENQHHLMTAPVIGPTVKETLHLEQNLEGGASGGADHIWANEYLNNGSTFNETLGNTEEIWSNAEKNAQSELGLGPHWAEQYLSSQAALLDHQQEGAKVVAASGEGDELAATAGAVAQILEGDPNMQYSKFVKFMQILENKETSNRSVIEEKVATNNLEDEWVQEFTNSNKGDTSDFPQTSTDEKTLEKFWKTLEDNWRELATEDNNWLSFSEESNLRQYQFASENPMTNVDDPIQLGKEKIANYDIPSAVLCFEVACQRQPENAEAWRLLGMAQAENEQDPLAIQALEHSLHLEPDNLHTLLALAISQTNENFQSQACNTLMRWIQVNPKYSHLAPKTESKPLTSNVTSFMSDTQFQQAEELFIKAVNLDRSSIDEDVQTCLGVLFCLSSEYDKAVDCFNTALQVKPNDPRLWNRVGASLANSNKSEEAVNAYRRALELNPGFIRARYNLGIACINLKAYREAAEHFIEALNQQAKIQESGVQLGDNIPRDLQHVMSDAIWMTLRTCCNLMNRQDLRPFLDARDLAALNHTFSTALPESPQ